MGEEKWSILPDEDFRQEGYNNANLIQAAERIRKMGVYRNQAVVIVCPTMRWLPVPIVASWLALLRPMNQKMAGPLLYDGFEVAEAYNQALDWLTRSKQFSDFPFLLTVEHDNLPPRDGLIKLLESIDGGVDGNRYDAVSGLYWTKKLPEGYPNILGNPAEDPDELHIQVPLIDTIQPCNAMGMGFTLWRLSMFRDGKIEKPFFYQKEQLEDGAAIVRQSQDAQFFLRAGKAGYKFAVDTRVKVGHMDLDTFEIW